MSQKFSFLIIVESNGSFTTKAYKKEDAQIGLDDFAKTRANGKEAHFYQCPKADKRCKSIESREELERFTNPQAEEKIEEQVVKPSRKSSKSESKPLDLE
jgi:actin-related protein